MSHQQTRRCVVCDQDHCTSHPLLPQDLFAAQEQERELRTWVKNNRTQLLKYEADELGYMAHVCLPWIDASFIHTFIPELYRDLQTRSTLKLRLDYHVKRETDFIQECHGNPLLDEQWHHLMHYENGEDWAA